MLKIIELARFFIECFLKVQILSLGIRLKILYRERETYLGDWEKSDPPQDEEGHGVEPTSNVGEDPEWKTKLDGVEHVLHHEQPSANRSGH